MSSTYPGFNAGHHPALSWRSVLAGFLVSFFVFGILLSLGVALGGVSLTDGASLRGSGIASGIWMLVSVLLSLFAGSYFASRVSNFVSPWVGMAQGAVLCALFVGALLWQFATLATWVTRTAGGAATSAVQGALPAAQQAASGLDIGLNEIIEDNLSGVQFKGEPTTIITGVASRLVRGNTESAKAYLARNSNLSVSEVNTRIDQAQVQLRETGDRAREAAAGAMQATGWTLFATMVLGLIVSSIAGMLGTTANSAVPTTRASFFGFRAYDQNALAR